MTRLVTHATWRFPKARPAHTSDHGWLVILDGPAQNVVPRGVHEIDVNDHPLHLDTTVDDAYLSLDQASQVDDDEEAIEALATHARTHPVSRFLCQHGLPMGHGGPDHCRMLTGPSATAAITLNHVRTMMDGLRGLENLARHLATRNSPARPDQVAAALGWQILPTYLTGPARAETQRDGELFHGRCQQIVTSSLRILQDTSLLRRDIEWTRNRRLQMVAHAHTDLGLYIYAFTVRVSNATNPGSRDSP